jgi:ribosome-associated heat shock protein Hsp15
MGGVERTRIDRWLWAVRLYKTRSAAQQACRGGHVRLNGERVKPAGTVKVGDTVEIHESRRERVVEVAAIIETRVGAPVARECLIDHSPEPTPRAFQPSVPQRERGAGRPTKRERRQLEREWGGRRR